MKRVMCGAALALLWAPVGASAHHAFAAEYDVSKVVTIAGTVTGFKWANPHAWLYVDGMDESGKQASWSFEMVSPTGLVHRGWRRGDLKKGDRVTVEGYCAKDGSNVATARSVTLPDGRKLSAGYPSRLREPVK